VGSAEYWSVEGSRRLFQAVEGSRAVRFIVNEFTPVAGFAEIAYAIKTRFPEKDVSIHVVFIHDDYKMFMSIQREYMVKSGVEISEEPPPYREGELRVSVPAVRIHPIAAGLDVDPVTFETQHERVYLIGDSSLLKLGLPPIGWGLCGRPRRWRGHWRRRCPPACLRWRLLIVWSPAIGRGF
ncbi:MAG: hypothetical protein ACP5J3_11665, partial [Pyrobaculum sp.]